MSTFATVDVLTKSMRLTEVAIAARIAPTVIRASGGTHDALIEIHTEQEHHQLGPIAIAKALRLPVLTYTPYGVAFATVRSRYLGVPVVIYGAWVEPARDDDAPVGEWPAIGGVA